MKCSTANPIAGKTLVFIGGLHRSGTSLLHQILREHAAVSGFQQTGIPEDEGQHLQTVYKPAKAFGGPGRFGFDARSFMDENHPLVSASRAIRLFEQWSQYWDLQKAYLIEKSPPNVIRARFLQALFPTSAFIMLLRHPIAVAYATKKFSRWSTISSLVEHSLICYERLKADLRFLERVYLIRYEDFVQQPQNTVNEICRFIGIKSQPVTVEVRSDVNEKYFKIWERDSQGIRGLLADTSWPRRLEDRARRFGYSLTAPRIALPWDDPLGQEQREIARPRMTA